MRQSVGGKGAVALQVNDAIGVSAAAGHTNILANDELGGAIIHFTGWTWVDPLEGVPGNLTVSQVAAAMETVDGVGGVHDLHMWTVGPGYPALSAHVVLADQVLNDTQRIMDELKYVLREEFDFEHITIQLECQHCGQGALLCASDPITRVQP